jgi:hypothetical protein
MSKLRVYTVFGRKFRAHPECSEGFKTDRRYGAIYGPYRIKEDDGSVRWAKDAEEMSMLCYECPYCGAA